MGTFDNAVPDGVPEIVLDFQRRYARGTLYGTEVRAYLLDKWDAKCAYCGKPGKEVEHLVPKSRGGSDGVSNLVLSCKPCNKKKGVKTIEEFLKRKPAVLRKIQAQQVVSLAHTAAVNSTKTRLLEALQGLGHPVDTASGAHTSHNRTTQGYTKAHWVDATCVGVSGERVVIPALKPLRAKCLGQGSRKMCTTNGCGIPVQHRQRQRQYYGFQTGDLARVVVTTGKKQGMYIGRVTVRATGSFRVGKVDGLHHRFFTLIQKGDGYAYTI